MRRVLASRRAAAALAVVTVATSLVSIPLRAQPTVGAIPGQVTDANHVPVPSATLGIGGASSNTMSNASGMFFIENVRTGQRVLVVRRPGFSPDSIRVDVRDGVTITQDVTLQSNAQQLANFLVSTSPRLNETKEQALFKQRNADNIVSVLSGDVIRALPNANAAEAIARVPGISTERDEGEGKFVQIRGTEPRLSNVTVNGVHIPGTQTGSRVAKLDDVALLTNRAAFDSLAARARRHRGGHRYELAAILILPYLNLLPGFEAKRCAALPTSSSPRSEEIRAHPSRFVQPHPTA